MKGRTQRRPAFCKASALDVVVGLCLAVAAVAANAGTCASPPDPRPEASIPAGGGADEYATNNLSAPLHSEPDDADDPLRASRGRPRLLPWFEFTTGMEPEARILIDQCRSVATWTDGAIVVTQTWGAWLYPRLVQEVPSLEIMPGARVVMFLQGRRLDDPAVWQDIAAYVSAVLTNPSGRFALEVEYPLYDYWEGKLNLDFPRLKQGLSYLPPGVEYLWYPGGLGHWNQEWLASMLQRALDLWRVIQSALPKVTFAAAGPSNTPEFFGRPQQITHDSWLRAEGRQFLDSIYISDANVFGPPWPLNSFAAYRAISLVRSREAYIWTTQEEWYRLGEVLLGLGQDPPRVRRVLRSSGRRGVQRLSTP